MLIGLISLAAVGAFALSWFGGARSWTLVVSVLAGTCVLTGMLLVALILFGCMFARSCV